jgi:hypothetical protein
MLAKKLKLRNSEGEYSFDVIEQAKFLWRWIQNPLDLNRLDPYSDDAFSEEDEGKDAQEKDKIQSDFSHKLLTWLQGTESFSKKERVLLEQSRPFRSQSGLGRVLEYRLIGCDSTWEIQCPKDEFNLFTWLYWNGLQQLEGSLEKLSTYDAFTDVYFNRNKRMMNCQARAAAMAVRLYKAEEQEDANIPWFTDVMQSIEGFRAFMGSAYQPVISS